MFNTDDDGVLWKLNGALEFGDDDLLYATWSQGYRRGGTNAVPTTGTFAEDPRWQVYGSDRVDNYEVGVKGRFNGMRYDASVFYINWEDAQLNTATPNWGFFAVQNSGGAHTTGLELQLSGMFNNEWGYSLATPTCRPNSTRTSRSPIGTLIDREGNSLPGAPEHMLNGAIGYTTPIGNYTFFARLTASISRKRATRSAYRRSSTSIWTASRSSTPSQPSPPITGTSFWVKNIGNEEGATGRYTEAYMGTDPADGYFGNGSKDPHLLPDFGHTRLPLLIRWPPLHRQRSMSRRPLLMPTPCCGAASERKRRQ